MKKSKTIRLNKKKVKRKDFSGILLLFLLVLFLLPYTITFNNKLSYVTFAAPKTPPVSTYSAILRMTTTPTITPSPTPVSKPAVAPETFLSSLVNNNGSSGYCLSVPVLMYHHIQPETTARALGQTALTVDSGVFSQQMAYLADNGYNTIWASDLIDALRNHTPLPPKTVVISMDDGYKDNYTYALPILEQYHLKANLMLASGLVDSNPDMLTWSDVTAMKNSGVYYFTDHTWSHYPISRGPESKIQFEIQTAQQEIQQHTGQTVDIFTYPYGSFNNNAIGTLISDGFIGGFSTIPGQVQCSGFIMTLHRTRIGNAPLSDYGI